MISAPAHPATGDTRQPTTAPPRVARFDRLRGWVEPIGFLVALGLTGWFGFSLVAADWGGLSHVAPERIVIACGLGAFAYAGLALCLVVAWRRLLLGFGIDPRGQGRVYAISQALKYLPGNVMHFAGRHAMARRLGAPHKLLILVAAVEAVLLLLAGAIVSLLAGPGLASAVTASTGLPLSSLGLVVPALLALLVAVFGVGRWLNGRMAGHGMRWDGLTGPMLTAFGLYLTFFVGCGLIGYGLASFALGLFAPVVLLLTGALAVSWTVGFLTPGAPAGLGVREVVLVSLLSPFLGTSGALALAALYRITTVAGDGLLALTALVGVRKPAPNPIMDLGQ